MTHFRTASLLVAAVAGCGGGTGDSGATSDRERASLQLTGCYDVTVGEWVVESRALLRLRRVPVPSARDDSTDYEIPPRIEFAGPREPPSSRMAIVVPEGALPSVHAYMYGEITGDSLDLSFSTGYAGVTARLARSGDGWAGAARTFIDVSSYPVHARPITLAPAACDSPPPASIDEMRPALARSVELEDGLVIKLGEPLPELLAAEAVSSRPVSADSTGMTREDWQLVTGRTRGLFGTTDSIAVSLNQSRAVTVVRLRYRGGEAFAELDGRLRGEYGAPRWSNATRSHFVNRITYLSLYQRQSDGAEVLLSGSVTINE